MTIDPEAFRFTETTLFARQNERFVAGLSGEEANELDGYAEHHAGGLYVLLRQLDEHTFVKAHDSWDDDTVVVHVYETDGLERSAVRKYATGSGALRNFLEADESWLPRPDRTYCVGLPVTFTVSDDGTVTYEVDFVEAGAAIRETYPVVGDEDSPDEPTVDEDADTVDRWMEGR